MSTSEYTPVLLTLPSLAPALALEVLPHGLTIHRFIVQADGRTHDIVIGPELPTDHAFQKYTNSVVGRYSNRVEVGTHKFVRKGVSGEMTAILNEGTRVSLHGGPTGFDAVEWTPLSAADPPTLFTPKELAHLPAEAGSYAFFRLVSPDGDQGYPGTLVTEALIALVAPAEADSQTSEYDLGSVVLVYRAKLKLADGATAKVVTPVNLTQHWGFNLDASQKDNQTGDDALTVKTHNLTIKSTHIANRDSDSLSIGFLPSPGTAHEHNATPIGEGYPPMGYDDYYKLAQKGYETVPTRLPASALESGEVDLLGGLLSGGGDGRLPPVVELSSAKSGLKVVFDSNQAGVMFYSFAWTDGSKGARKKIHGGSGERGKGDSYSAGSAAFLEFHDPLAAFLDPANKDGEDTLLTSDEVYHNYVRCDVRFKRPSVQ
ncbi:galactose mutarotase-like domain-containing protein [Mycena amicta]|nr:galactose mutarotase-like domain-containing protein [Mycena amicta]